MTTFQQSCGLFILFKRKALTWHMLAFTNIIRVCTIFLENNGKMSSSKHIKHIKAKFFFITDKVKQREVIVEYLPTKKCGSTWTPNQRNLVGNVPDWLSRHFSFFRTRGTCPRDTSWDTQDLSSKRCPGGTKKWGHGTRKSAPSGHESKHVILR